MTVVLDGHQHHQIVGTVQVAAAVGHELHPNPSNVSEWMRIQTYITESERRRSVIQCIRVHKSSMKHCKVDGSGMKGSATKESNSS